MRKKRRGEKGRNIGKRGYNSRETRGERKVGRATAWTTSKCRETYQNPLRILLIIGVELMWAGDTPQLREIKNSSMWLLKFMG